MIKQASNTQLFAHDILIGQHRRYVVSSIDVGWVESCILFTHVGKGLSLLQSPECIRVSRGGVHTDIALSNPSPPLVDIFIPCQSGVIMHQCTQPAEKFGVNELS